MKRHFKKILPKTKIGETIDSMGGGGPRGFSRSGRVSEVKTKTSRAKKANRSRNQGVGRAALGGAIGAAGAASVYKGKHRNPHTT
tara:strand:+ start:794 stop:1048 length:255 start_codon:yes stop_codon:yes gene_type:complete